MPCCIAASAEALSADALSIHIFSADAEESTYIYIVRKCRSTVYIYSAEVRKHCLFSFSIVRKHGLAELLITNL